MSSLVYIFVCIGTLFTSTRHYESSDKWVARLVLLFLGTVGIHHFECGLDLVEKVFNLLGLGGAHDEQKDNDDGIDMRQKVRTLSTNLRVRRARHIGNPSQNECHQRNSEWQGVTTQMPSKREKSGVSF